MLQDLKLSWRALWRQPRWTVPLLLLMSLGISVNVVVFSFVDSILLRSLAFEDADQLVALDEYFQAEDKLKPLSPLTFDDLVDSNPGFEALAAFTTKSFVQEGEDWPLRVVGARVTRSFFQVFRVEPLRGRLFAEDECSEANGVLIAETFWRQRFGGQESALGSLLRLDDRAFEILGVVPDRLAYPLKAEIWLPLCFDRAAATYSRGNRYLNVVGRRLESLSPAQAKSRLDAFSGALRAENTTDFPADSGWSLQATALSERKAGAARDVLGGLVVAVGFVLLVTSVNIAGLWLLRAFTRRREITTHLILGSSFGRLRRRMLMEASTLGIVGGIVALPAAFLFHHMAVYYAPSAFAASEFEINAPVLAFTLLLSFLTSLFFGMAPILLFTGLRKGLGNMSRRGTQDRGGRNLLRSLVVLEVGVTTMLLIGTGLMIQGMIGLLSVDLGFEPENTYVFRTHISHSKFNAEEERLGFHRNLLPRARSIPGVEKAATVSTAPFSGLNWSMEVSAKQRPPEQRLPAAADLRIVSPGYFDAMGISLHEGRDFTELDHADGFKVAIVDRRFAADVWPETDPIGQEIRLGGPDDETPWLKIVGVVGDVFHTDLEKRTAPHLYIPYEQFPLNVLNLVVHSEMAPSSLLRQVREAVAEVDGFVAVDTPVILQAAVDSSTENQRFITFLLAIFGLFGWFLSALGILAVTGLVVEQRRREIGIRQALGAEPYVLIRKLTFQSFLPVLMGLFLGSTASFLLPRLLSGVLPNDTSLQVGTYVMTLGFLGLVSIVSAYLPIRQGANQNINAVLRAE